MAWCVSIKLPNSYTMFYQSRFTTDEAKARELYARKKRTMEKKGYDVWLSSWNNSKETVVEGPGWRVIK